MLRLQSYLRFWLEKSGLPSTYGGLTELIVSQQFFQSLDKNNQVFIKEQGRLSLQEMIEKAQNYSDAHQVHESQFGQFDKRNVHHHDKNRYQNQFKSRDNGSNTQSFNGKAENSKSKEQNGSFRQKKEVDNSQSREQNRFFQQKKEFIVKCNVCGRVGHKSYQCDNRQNGNQDNGKKPYQQSTQHKSAVCQIEQRRLVGKESQNKEDDVFPIIALASEVESEEYLNDLKFPYRGKARVNGRSVEYMRDTGSSLTLIQENYVKPEDYTGKKVSVLLADRCVRFYPEVSIEISSPCYSGTIKALALKYPVHTLVIGNNIFQKQLTTAMLSDTARKGSC